MWFEVDLGQHRLRCDGQNYAMLISRRELPVVDPDFCLSVGVGGAYIRTLFFRLAVQPRSHSIARPTCTSRCVRRCPEPGVTQASKAILNAALWQQIIQ